MTDAIDLIAKADKLVWAWCRGSQSGLERAMDEWLEARRSAREAGYVEVLLSRESIEALRAAQGDGDVVRACNLLARDLDDVLKEGSNV